MLRNRCTYPDQKLSGVAVYGCAGRGDCAGNATSIAAVGSLVAGNGKYDHSDLAGNVWEWNLDGVAVYGVPCTDCAEIENVASRVNRGGDFLQASSYLLNSDRGTAAPEAHSYLRGLRCARMP